MATTYCYGRSGLLASEATGTNCSAGSNQLQFSWDLTSSVPLLLSDGQNSYLYGPDDRPIEQIDANGNPSYLHHDQLGSTRDSRPTKTATPPQPSLTTPTGSSAAALALPRRHLGTPANTQTHKPDSNTTAPATTTRRPVRIPPAPRPARHGHTRGLRLHLRQPGQRHGPKRARVRDLRPRRDASTTPQERWPASSRLVQPGRGTILSKQAAWFLGAVSLGTGAVAAGVIDAGVASIGTSALGGVSAVTGVVATTVDGVYCANGETVSCVGGALGGAGAGLGLAGTLRGCWCHRRLRRAGHGAGARRLDPRRNRLRHRRLQRLELPPPQTLPVHCRT